MRKLPCLVRDPSIKYLQHLYGNPKFRQRIADLPLRALTLGGRREREPESGYPPAITAGIFNERHGSAGRYDFNGRYPLPFFIFFVKICFNKIFKYVKIYLSIS